MSRLLLIALGVAALALGEPASAQAPVKAPDSGAARYEACMALVRSDPRKGVEGAVAWRREGGETAAAADHCLATALVARGDAAEGARLLEELASEPTEPRGGLRARLYGQAGRAWLDAGEPKRAWAALADGLKLDPESSDMLIDRAIANAGLGLVWDAIDDLNRALELAPGRADALVLRGAGWRRLESYDLADDDIGLALALQPNNVDALLERAQLRRVRGRDADARADWVAVMTLDPEGPSGETARRNIDAMDAKRR